MRSWSATHAQLSAASLPLWMIERELREETLVRLPIAAFGKAGETTLQTYLARRADRPLGPAASAFREVLFANLVDTTTSDRDNS